MVNFPTSLDSFTNPVGGVDRQNSVTVPHATQHSNLNDAVEALEAKVGIDGSAVATSLDYKVANKQDVSVEKSTDFTAALHGSYVVTATCTVTDPGTPSQGHEFTVLVWNGTATVGGTAYSSKGTVLRRVYHSGSWTTEVYKDAATFATAGAVTSSGLTMSTAKLLGRSTAGTGAVEEIAAPSGTIVGTSDTQTLTNKRFTRRVGSTTSSATPTINTDDYDVYRLTAQTVDITSFTTNLSGTPVDGDLLWISITGTAARAITWGSSFESSTATLPTTTVTTNRLDVGFVWNSATSKFRCVAVA